MRCSIPILLSLFFALVTMADASPRYREGEVLVRYRNPSVAAKSIAGWGGTTLHRYRMGIRHIRLPAGESVEERIRLLSQDPAVEWAEPNWIVRKSALIPDDPLFNDQWALLAIDAATAWETFVGTRAPGSKIVAVLDTGVAYDHEALAPNLWRNPDEECANGRDDDNNGVVDDCLGASFGGTNLPNDPWDDDTQDAHGTHVAGIIGAVGNDGTGTVGVNWYVRIMPVKVLHGPSGEGDFADILKGVEYAIGKGASIINMSFELDEPSRFLDDAIARADEQGVLVVSAAGNYGRDIDAGGVYPASIRRGNHITVAASTRVDTLADFSDYGRHRVDLAAPGGDRSGGILSTVWLDRGATLYRETPGTSMAAPHVAGAAALIWNRWPDLTSRQVRGVIMNSTAPLEAFRRMTITGGRLDLSRLWDSLWKSAIFSVDPYELPPEGGVVTVEGVNFGGTPGRLLLDTTEAEILSWSDTLITARIPGGSRSGYLRVNGDGSGFHLRVLNPPRFTLTPSVTAPLVGEVVSLRLDDVDPQPVRTTWNCGDGSLTSAMQGVGEISCSYRQPGEYHVRVTVEVDDGQTATREVVVTVQNPSGSSGSTSCFIATAAFGTPLHPRVEALRAFRDRCLMTNRFGRLLVGLYYRTSPPVAAVIARHEPLRMGVRGLLAILILLMEEPLAVAVAAGCFLAPLVASRTVDPLRVHPPRP